MIPGSSRDFSRSFRVQTGYEVHPAFYTMGTGDFSPGIKRPGHEADHSPPSSVDVKKSGAIGYLDSPTRLHGVELSYPPASTFTFPFYVRFQSIILLLPGIHNILYMRKAKKTFQWPLQKFVLYSCVYFHGNPLRHITLWPIASRAYS